MRIPGFLGVVAIGLTSLALTGQTPGGEPAYVVRGHQAEVRQRALKERLDRFHAALTDAVHRDAPDLLPRLDPPPAIAYGYQILRGSSPTRRRSHR